MVALSPSSRSAAEQALAGMRRVDRVVIAEGARVRFYVEGIGHRFPGRREITAVVASELMTHVPCRHEWRPTARRTA